MQERFWLVLIVLLIMVVAGFASMGTRGIVAHGRETALLSAVQQLPAKLFGDLRDMTMSLAESLNGTRGTDDPQKQ